MKFVLAAALIVSAGAVQAGGPVVVADDPVIAAPAAPASWDWTGLYAGLSATNGSFDNGTTDYDTSGFGIQVGYLRDLGRVVLGGELSYSKGDFGNLAPTADWKATRVKLIGGYDAGRFLPYAFVGMTKFDIAEGTENSDTMPNYGIGARFAMGPTGKFVAGLEYLVESKDNFDGTGTNTKNGELSLRLDYRF
ncbi:MAG: outer membrane beta-barrel protein [Paracoccaceae bacterium]|jgi:outer membrane immunogenic protein